jgi:hypothetical protein
MEPSLKSAICDVQVVPLRGQLGDPVPMDDLSPGVSPHRSLPLHPLLTHFETCT